jgi:hypothetical protein
VFLISECLNGKLFGKLWERGNFLENCNEFMEIIEKLGRDGDPLWIWI